MSVRHGRSGSDTPVLISTRLRHVGRTRSAVPSGVEATARHVGDSSDGTRQVTRLRHREIPVRPNLTSYAHTTITRQPPQMSVTVRLSMQREPKAASHGASGVGSSESGVRSQQQYEL